MRRSIDHGPPPTIGQLRGHGVTGFFVRCLTYGCASRPRRFGFDELGLPDDMVFLDLATRHRRFRCRLCGARSTELDLDWRDHVASGNARRPRRR